MATQTDPDPVRDSTPTAFIESDTVRAAMLTGMGAALVLGLLVAGIGYAGSNPGVEAVGYALFAIAALEGIVFVGFAMVMAKVESYLN